MILLLSDIYLASVDRKIKASLDKEVFLKVVHYMDDYSHVPLLRVPLLRTPLYEQNVWGPICHH